RQLAADRRREPVAKARVVALAPREAETVHHAAHGDQLPREAGEQREEREPGATGVLARRDQAVEARQHLGALALGERVEELPGILVAAVLDRLEHERARD